MQESIRGRPYGAKGTGGTKASVNSKRVGGMFWLGEAANGNLTVRAEMVEAGKEKTGQGRLGSKRGVGSGGEKGKKEILHTTGRKWGREK